MGLRELQALVASRYRSLGLPAWPDPHAAMESLRDEEYSRVTDPERQFDRFGVCDTMIVEWLDVPRLDERAQGSAQRNWHGTRRLLTIHPAPCPD